MNFRLRTSWVSLSSGIPDVLDIFAVAYWPAIWFCGCVVFSSANVQFFGVVRCGWLTSPSGVPEFNQG